MAKLLATRCRHPSESSETVWLTAANFSERERRIIQRFIDRAKARKPNTLSDAKTAAHALERAVRAQQMRAAAPRKESLAKIVVRLAKRESTSPELWNDLVSSLNGEEKTNEKGNVVCEYEDDGGEKAAIAFRTFQNRISAARKPVAR